MAEYKHTDSYDGPQENKLMASEDSSKDGKQFICGICLENYTTPRYLPTCGHTFCEHCLFKHASNLHQQRSKLECPVCRKPHNLPDNNEVTLDWIIQTFPLNAVIESLSKSSKDAAEERQNCDACKEGGDIIEAVKLCLDCKEKMCEACTKCHKRFKVTSRHKLVDIKELSTEAKFAGYFHTFTNCPDHPDKEVELYCKSHDVVICAVCALNNHSQTCTAVEISSHDTNVNNIREESEKLTSQMKEIIGHINLLQKFREENKSTLKKELIEIRSGIDQVRDQIVTLIDTIVTHVTTVTKQIEIDNEDEIHVNMSRVSKIKEHTEEKLAFLDTVKQHGSVRHKFISAHLIKSQIKEIARQISEEDMRLSNIDAELKVANDIRKLIENTDVEKLVHVTVNKSESSHKHLGAVSNYLRDSKLVMVDEHIVRPNAGCIPLYSCVAIYTDMSIILSDQCNGRYCGYLCLYNPTNRNMLKIKLNSPYSAAQIDDAHIAVSIPDDKTINIVTVGNELRVEKTLKTQYTPRCIAALSNGRLAVSWSSPPAFSIVDISGTEMVQRSYLDQDSSGRKFRSFEYLAVDRKRHHVIQPCNMDKAVYCFDFMGNPVFKYTDSRLTEPHGVALDRCGNIYVCEYNHPGSIHKVSPAGEPIEIFTEGVPDCPWAICTDRDGTGFWMTRIAPSVPYEAYDNVVYFRLEQNPGS